MLTNISLSSLSSMKWVTLTLLSLVLSGPRCVPAVLYAWHDEDVSCSFDTVKLPDRGNNPFNQRRVKIMQAKLCSLVNIKKCKLIDCTRHPVTGGFSPRLNSILVALFIRSIKFNLQGLFSISLYDFNKSV